MYAPTAVAQSSEYCAKVRSRAAGRAALLIAPRLFGDLLRYPSSFDTGPTTLDEFQLRVGLSFSPLDAYRGLRTHLVSDADCRAHEASRSIEQALAAGAEAYTLPALVAQLEYLEQHRTDWEGLLRRAEERLRARIITSFEYGQLAKHVDALERKIEELRGDAARIRLRSDGDTSAPVGLDGIEQAYLASALEYETRDSGDRSFDAWDLRLSGGMIPTSRENSPEWFGWLQLSYSLGGLWSDHYEDEYVAARTAELKQARYELSGRLRELERQLQGERERAVRELALVDKQLDFLVRTRTALDSADAAVAGQAQDALALEQLAAEAEQRYLRTLIETLTTVRGGEHG